MTYTDFLKKLDSKIPDKIESNSDFEQFQKLLKDSAMLADLKYKKEFRKSMVKYGIDSELINKEVKLFVDKIDHFFIDLDKFTINISINKIKYEQPLLTIEYFLSNMLNLKKDVFYYIFLGCFLNPVNFELLQLYILSQNLPK